VRFEIRYQIDPKRIDGLPTLVLDLVRQNAF
jgi:hypothetical protein